MTQLFKEYRKLPVVISAVQLTKENALHILQSLPIDQIKGARQVPDHGINIETLEGVMFARYGDYIIKGVNGEFYPCKPDIFDKTYESVGSYHAT